MTVQEKRFTSEEVEEEEKEEISPLLWIDDITLREKLRKHGVVG